MINGVHHVAISTRDLERASHFYRDIMGFEQGIEMSWEVGNPRADAIVGVPNSAARGFMFSGGNAYIEIWHYTSPEIDNERDGLRRSCDHGLAHICLDVADLDYEYERLQAAGMTFNSEPMRFPELGVATVYGRDPDGNIVELQEILDPALFPPIPPGTAAR